jgi:hypothetical protein
MVTTIRSQEFCDEGDLGLYFEAVAAVDDGELPSEADLISQFQSQPEESSHMFRNLISALADEFHQDQWDQSSPVDRGGAS